MILNLENPQNRNKLYLIIGIIVAIIVVFYLGIQFGQREDYTNNLNPKITSKLASGYQENILNKLKIKEITAFPDSKNSISVGKFYYYINGNKTDMSFKIEAAPNRIVNTEDNKEKEIPLELNIDIASRTADGLDFEYTRIGTIKLTTNSKKQLQGDFSAVAEFSIENKTIKNSQRIVFRPTKPEQENIFADKNPNLPLLIRGEEGKVGAKAAPYFFIEI